MTSTFRRLALRRDGRHVLALLAILLGIAEFADSFFISFWIGALAFSILFLVAGAWTSRGGVGGPILVGALCVFELQSFPTWQRSGVGDWIHQVAFLAVSAGALVIAVAVLKQSFSTRRTRVVRSEA